MPAKSSVCQLQVVVTNMQRRWTLRSAQERSARGRSAAGAPEDSCTQRLHTKHLVFNNSPCESCACFDSPLCRGVVCTELGHRWRIFWQHVSSQPSCAQMYSEYAIASMQCIGGSWRCLPLSTACPSTVWCLLPLQGALRACRPKAAKQVHTWS